MGLLHCTTHHKPNNKVKRSMSCWRGICTLAGFICGYVILDLAEPQSTSAFYMWLARN